MWYCKFLKAAAVGCHSGCDQNVIKRNDETKGCNLLLLRMKYVYVLFWIIALHFLNFLMFYKYYCFKIKIK